MNREQFWQGKAELTGTPTHLQENVSLRSSSKQHSRGSYTFVMKLKTFVDILWVSFAIWHSNPREENRPFFWAEPPPQKSQWQAWFRCPRRVSVPDGAIKSSRKHFEGWRYLRGWAASYVKYLPCNFEWHERDWVHGGNSLKLVGSPLIK